MKNKKNENKSFVKKIDITADTLATDGRAVSRSQDGIVVFVDQLLPSEKAVVEITSEKSNYKVAKVLNLESSSHLRVHPPCPHAQLCGGCQLQHVAVNHQIQFKTQWFIETLKRVGKWNEENISFVQKNLSVIPLISLNYRRRVRFHFDGQHFGFKKKGSNKIIDIDSCLIASKKINKKILSIKKNLIESLSIIKENKISRKLECEVEVTESDDKKIFFSISKTLIDNPNKSDICQEIIEKNLKILKDQYFLIKHPEVQNFFVKKQSFVQPHFDCLLLYYKSMKEYVELFLKSRILIEPHKNNLLACDLYAGAGVFTPLPILTGKSLGVNVQCLAVEGLLSAAESLKENLQNLDVKLVIKDVSAFIEDLFLKRKEPNFIFIDILILDPPRSGLGIEHMQKLVEVLSYKSLLIYLACDPASFARDTSLLFEAGFHLKRILLFDSFPYTVHYEILGIFER